MTSTTPVKFDAAKSGAVASYRLLPFWKLVRLLEERQAPRRNRQPNERHAVKVYAEELGMNRGSAFGQNAFKLWGPSYPDY